MQILEVNRNNLYLSKKQGFISLTNRDNEVFKIAFDNIDTIIVSAFGITYSHSLLQECCQRNIPIIFCGSNFMPVGYLFGYPSYFKHKSRIENQIKASKPFYKKTWQYLIKAKIRNQAQVLEFIGIENERLLNLANRVKSGDPENLEGLSARIYWKRLFGEDFYRDFKAEGINSFLNFGYAVLRGIIVRNIVSKGLLASYGIHHLNKTNPYCLADDIIEPYRPFIDLTIAKNLTDEVSLSPKIKEKIVSTTRIKVLFKSKTYNLEEIIKLHLEDFIKSLRTGKVVEEYAEVKKIKWTETDVDDCDV